MKVVKQKKARVETLLEMNTGRDDFDVKFDKENVTITLPESIAYDQNWPYAKFSLVRTLREHLNVATVIFGKFTSHERSKRKSDIKLSVDSLSKACETSLLDFDHCCHLAFLFYIRHCSG